MIPMQYALRRRMMVSGSASAPLSDLPIGSLIRCEDGGAGTANYEIASFDAFVSGDVCLVRKDIYGICQIYSSSPYQYTDGAMDKYMQNTVRGNLDAKLQAILIPVTFNTWGNNTSSITRNIFIPTCTMLRATKEYTSGGNNTTEGPQFSLYTSNTSRIKKYNGTATRWWSLSRYGGSAWYFIETDGTCSWGWGDDTTRGAVPTFVIPSSTKYSLTPNSDGSYNLAL